MIADLSRRSLSEAGLRIFNCQLKEHSSAPTVNTTAQLIAGPKGRGIVAGGVSPRKKAEKIQSRRDAGKNVWRAEVY